MKKLNLKEVIKLENYDEKILELLKGHPNMLKHYQAQLQEIAFLDALQDVGVDNWHGYSVAQKMMGDK